MELNWSQDARQILQEGVAIRHVAGPLDPAGDVSLTVPTRSADMSSAVTAG